MGDDNKPIEKKNPTSTSSSSSCCCCCCSVSGWIRVITWTKIVLYLLLTVSLTLILSTSGSMWTSWMPKKYVDLLLKYTMLVLWFFLTIPLPLILLVEVKLVDFFPRLQLTEKEGRQVFIVFGLILFLFFVGLIMAVILLKGVSQKSRRKLNAWMVYALICMTLTVFEAAAGIILQNLGLGLYDPPRLIVRVMVSMTFQAFEVGTVLMFRTRFVDEKEEDLSSTLTVAMTPAPAPATAVVSATTQPKAGETPPPVPAAAVDATATTTTTDTATDVKCSSA